MNDQWLAPCGLYCGVCGIRIASEENNTSLKQKLSKAYNLPVEEIHCEGCFSEDVFIFCRTCAIKSCAISKKLTGCHECGDFPCEYIEKFPVVKAAQVMKRAIPQRKKLGDEQWATEETQRYHCPLCGYPSFRGARRCPQCGEGLDLD